MVFQDRYFPALWNYGAVTQDVSLERFHCLVTKLYENIFHFYFFIVHSGSSEPSGSLVSILSLKLDVLSMKLAFVIFFFPPSIPSVNVLGFCKSNNDWSFGEPSCEPCNELGFGEISRDFILWIGDPVILSVSEPILSNEAFDPDNLTPADISFNFWSLSLSSTDMSVLWTTSGKLLYGVTSFMSSLPLGGEEGLCVLSTSSLDTSCLGIPVFFGPCCSDMPRFNPSFSTLLFRSFKLQAPKTTSSVGVQWYDFSPGCGSLSPNDALCTNIPSEKYNSKVREGLEWGSLPQRVVFTNDNLHGKCFFLFTKGYSKMFCMWKKGERNKAL